MERSSFRARLFFVAGPAAAIVWSVYAAVLTADARQRASEADQSWRHQYTRVEATRRRLVRARNEARLALLRRSPGGLVADAGGSPAPTGGAPAVGSAPTAAAVAAVAVVAAAGPELAAAPVGSAGAAPMEIGDVLADTARPPSTAPGTPGAAVANASAAPAASSAPLASTANGAPGMPGGSGASVSPGEDAAEVAAASPAASVMPAASGAPAPTGVVAFAPSPASDLANEPVALTGRVPVAIPVPAPAPVTGVSPVNGAAVVGTAAQGRTAGVPADSIAVARAAAAERAQLILALREKLDGIQVQVDEIRLGSAHESGTEWVRTVRIQLSGKKDLVKRAVAQLKAAEPVKELVAGKLEPLKSAKGEMRTTVVGTLRAANPQSLARG